MKKIIFVLILFAHSFGSYYSTAPFHFHLCTVNQDSTLRIHFSDTRFVDDINRPDMYGESIVDAGLTLSHLIFINNLLNTSRYTFDEQKWEKYQLLEDGNKFSSISGFSPFHYKDVAVDTSTIYTAILPRTDGLGSQLSFRIDKIYYTRYELDVKDRFIAITNKVNIPPGVKQGDMLVCFRGVPKVPMDKPIQSMIPGPVDDMLDSLKTVFMKNRDISSQNMDYVNLSVQPYEVNVYKIYGKMRYLVSIWTEGRYRSGITYCLDESGKIVESPAEYTDGTGVAFRAIRIRGSHGPRDYLFGLKPLGVSLYMVGSKGRLHEIIHYNSGEGA